MLGEFALEINVVYQSPKSDAISFQKVGNIKYAIE